MKYGGWLVSRRGGSVVLLDDHAVGQVLGVVFKELSGGSGAVGQLQLLQLLQLDEARQTGGGQQGATWMDTAGGTTFSCGLGDS